MSLKQTLINANTTLNVGRWDRVVRALLPFVVGGLWLGGVLPAVAAIPLLVFTVMLFPTSLTGACSIYYATGISTLPDKTSTGSRMRTDARGRPFPARRPGHSATRTSGF